MNKNTCGIVIFPSEVNRRSVRQIIESGIEIVGIHAAFSDNGKDCVQKFIEKSQDAEFSTCLKLLQSAGITVEYELHAMDWLLPHEMWKEHPDYFRMDETGERKADFNLCPSNPEALAFVETKARELASLFPSVQSHRYYVWIDDGGSYCHCPKCQGLTASDQALIVYNHILKGIKQWDPLAKQCYLAYQKTITAPEHVKPEEGIFLEYAPIDRESGMAINDSRCEKNMGQRQALEGLLELFGAEDAQVLDYWLDNSRFYQWREPYGELPFYEHVIRQDVLFYRAQGFKRMTCFACRAMDDEYVAHYGEPPLEKYVKLLQ